MERLESMAPLSNGLPQLGSEPSSLASLLLNIYLAQTTTIQPHEWPTWLDQWVDDGWQLETIEMPPTIHQPCIRTCQSLFHLRVSLDRKQANDRMWITGPVWVDWQKKAFPEEGANRIQRIDED